MQTQTQDIRYFLYSQAFADGFRATFSILVPSLVASYFDMFEAGLAISLGALCANLADAPGPFIHKRNGMLICSLSVFLVVFITVFARLNIYTMGLEIAGVCFFFSMFNVYGSRATSVGNAAILAMILTMDKPNPPSAALTNSLLVLGGGLWYTTISLLLYKLRPYRVPQRVLGECIMEMAKYLSIKADFYDSTTSLYMDYKKLVAQQVVVNEQQNTVREILFKTRQIVKETTSNGRKLVMTFVDTVDLFEDITASYYDYSDLRKRFEHTGILKDIADLIRDMAVELNKIGFAIQANETYKRNDRLENELKILKEKIDAISRDEASSNLVLKKILVNARKLLHRFNDISGYFYKADNKRKESLDHTQFVSHQSLGADIFWNNLTLQSSVLKHALRVAIGCMVGFIVAKLIAYGHHSYWILMTIAFMLKPAFSLTKQRNIHRIAGTLIGGIIGILILSFIPNTKVLFALMVLFMLGTYSFQRINYLAMVVCTTPYIFILFKFLGVGFLKLAEERLMDTAIGCAIAFAVGYFIFPHWESRELEKYMRNMLEANLSYLQKILESLNGKAISVLDYKLVRKEVYVSSANLSAAFQRMLSEPKNKQIDSTKVHQFVVLNYVLFSNIATIATTLFHKESTKYPGELILLAKRSK
ncbi:MAG TPA: FUSC family membrane protein, partial [Flavisolibacter sp.]|nr:FUSC family membrane protein [Flavisolibacter sp.]